MPYFPVDDELTYHPKVVAAGNAAIGVWARGGAWAKKYATGGFVSREVAHGLGARESKALVTAGLWKVGDHPKFGTGYWFHDWEHQAGNFDGDEEKSRLDAKREADRERQRRKRDRERDADASHGVTPPRISFPSSPSPSPKTDVTHLPGSSPDSSVRAEGLDEPGDLTRKRLERALVEADRLGIKSLPKLREVLEETTDTGMTLGAVLELTKAILSRSRTSVAKVEAYVIAACRKTPDEVRELADQLDVGAIA